ncbi:DMT family transporter [Paenibacillus gorillae]|uniref:DMT family transporter n=1 Tax=Paenibacillus gorillae TaxID=1243662 RepID=UPI0004B73459|nr:DMT family transporter [Paenibacillus gorillae]
MVWLLFSILAACSFGLRGILYHWTSQKPLSRNALLCGTFFSGAVITLICAVVTGQQWTMSALIGLQMGLFSFGANASMFKGFAVGKASLVAILTALPSVVVAIVAYLLWAEKLNGMQFLAFAVIITGILLVRYSNDLSWSNLQGAQWGFLAMLLFAGNDLSGKWSTMMEAQMFPTLVCMFAMGSLCFGLWWLKDLRGERLAAARAVGIVAANGAFVGATIGNGSEGAAVWGESETGSAGAIVRGEREKGSPGAIVRGESRKGSASADNETVRGGRGAKVQIASAAVSPVGEKAASSSLAGWSGKRTFLTGLGVGITNAVGMMLIITAFDHGKAGLVSAVTALNVLIVLLYTRFVVKEKFTKLETIGIVTAFAGILLMRLFGG